MFVKALIFLSQKTATHETELLAEIIVLQTQIPGRFLVSGFFPLPFISTALLFPLSYLYYLFAFFFFEFVAMLPSMRILVPRPGIEPMPLVVEMWCLNHWTFKKPPLLSAFD